MTTRLNALMTIATHLLAVDMVQDDMKERAIKNYKHALTLPRKQKKQAKKEAILDYSIACWDPFNF